MRAKIFGLAAIAIMSVLLLLQYGGNTPSQDSRYLLLPELESQLASVTRVEVRDLQEDWMVSAEMQDGTWIVPEKAGYAADFEVLSELLRGLAELEIAEKKTARSENHAQLGVASEGDGAGTLIRVEATDFFEVILGEPSVSRGAFMRLPGEDQVYLSDEGLLVPDSVMALVDPVIINIESADVSRVEINSEGSLVAAARDESSGDLLVSNLPDGAELKYDGVADSLARILVNLRMTDVHPEDPAVFEGAATTTVTTSSGDKVTVSSMKTDDGYWVRLDSKSGWQFKVSEYSYNQLNKKMSDLIKTEESEESAE